MFFNGFFHIFQRKKCCIFRAHFLAIQAGQLQHVFLKTDKGSPTAIFDADFFIWPVLDVAIGFFFHFALDEFVHLFRGEGLQVVLFRYIDKGIVPLDEGTKTPGTFGDGETFITGYRCIDFFPFFDQFQCTFQGNRKWVFPFGYGDEFFTKAHIRTIPPGTHGHFLAAVITQNFGQFKQLHGFFHLDGFDGLAWLEVGVTGFFTGDQLFGSTDLHHWPQTGHAGEHRIAGSFLFTQNALTGGAIGIGHRFFHNFVERPVEGAQHFGPFAAACGNVVKQLFDFSRELVVHDFIEMLIQKIAHGTAHIGREQTAFDDASHFRQFFFVDLCILEGQLAKSTWGAIAVFLDHITPAFFHDFADGWRIGGRATNAQFFQFFHQTCF